MKIFPINSTPIYTLLIVISCITIQYFPEIHSGLYFDKAAILQGEWWRLVTGHFMHADNEHLLWNTLGLLILGALIEKYSVKALFLSLFSGVLCIDILLMSSFCELEIYCGLSGTLNSLLVLALWYEWKQIRSFLAPLIAGLSLLKIWGEISIGNSVFTHISWPPYPWAHLAGFIGGSFLVILGNVLLENQHFKTKFCLE